ncbi:MAG: hypothetical protein WD738_23535 [Pirellulales bacterium]
MSSSMVSTPSNIFHRLTAFRERYGTKGAVYKSLDVALHKVLRTSVHAVVWLDVESLAKMAPPDRQFTFRFLTADEVATYATDPTYYIDPALADRVREGRDVCFAALAGDRLAAFGCYMLESIEPEHASGVAMSYPPDVAYMSYGFTHPDFRGARLHGLVMGLALQELAKRGVTKLVSLVAWTNWASLKSCNRLGYINLGNMIAVGGRKRAIGMYPKAAKKLGVRFGRKAAKRA